MNNTFIKKYDKWLPTLLLSALIQGEEALWCCKNKYAYQQTFINQFEAT
jgi:hypothetical protein